MCPGYQEFVVLGSGKIWGIAVEPPVAEAPNPAFHCGSVCQWEIPLEGLVPA